MDIGSLLKRVWPAFTQNIVAWLLALVAAFVIVLVLSVLNVVPLIGSLAFFVGYMVVVAFIMGGYALMAGKALSGVAISVTDLVVPFQERQLDYALVGLAVMSGSLLCGFGALVTGFLFMLAPIMVADGMGYEEALKKSYETVMGDPAGYLVVWIVGSLIAAFTCGLLGPIFYLLLAQVYLDRKNGEGSADAAQVPQAPQTF